MQAENDARIFYRQHRPFPGAMLDLRTVEDHASYERHDKESSCTWSAFVSACRLVNADPNAVMATVKAMNFWSAPDPDTDYFQSTGRRKPWTVKEKSA